MIVIMGSSGRVGGQVASRLLAEGHAVRVIGRSAAQLSALAQAGAETALGSVTDAAFLGRAFTGASAVFVMTPPGYAEPDMTRWQASVADAVVQALAATRPARVVHLSSLGADQAAGNGPIAGLHATERRLDVVVPPGALLHLRPAYFMENLLELVPAFAATGALASMEAPDAAIPMVATADIAAVAARELATPRSIGVLQLHAPGLPTMADVARLAGAAIGRPGLPYVQMAPAEVKPMLVAQGFSASAADAMAELSHWLGDSQASLASLGSAPVELQPTTLEAFVAQRLAPALAAAGQPAAAAA
jgi:uncharacterized protein YbjT (DUF2867 family)